MKDALMRVLEELESGKLSAEKAREKIAGLNIRQVGECARLDVLRMHRTGVPEVVLAQNKTPEDIAKILMELAKANNQALATKVKKEDVSAVKKVLPAGFALSYNEKARTILVRNRKFHISREGSVGILAAGTADIPIAEEASVTLDVMGCSVLRGYDVGIAGIHRLFGPLEEMMNKKADAIIVVAGMEGCLPGIVAGLVSVPVIGVPTSVGYGVGSKGVSALLTMLNSCSPGLVVVNIDNGFGAGVVAGLIARRRRGIPQPRHYRVEKQRRGETRL